MSTQIKPSVTNPTIADIYEKIDTNRLDLSPDFQRKFVWTQEHQEQFLDTILHGFPFPEIYVCQGITDTKKLRTTQKVIDGQQRLTTIKNYIENDFKKDLRIVPSFVSLTEEQREDFLSYQIVVRDIGKVEEGLIREIFRRINLTKFKLEDIEIHNAIYDGKFIQVAKDLANEVELDQFGVFHESEFTRMADVHFFLQVMSTLIRGGYFPRDNEVEKCVAEYNEEFPESHKVKSQVLKAIAIIQDLGLEVDSIWFRKSCFFTLVVELCFAGAIPSDLISRLNEFDQNVLRSKNMKETDHGLFYHSMYSGTNDRKARINRSDLFKKYMLV
ncbi:DUF262 domain-containing protein [Acidithiobacillus sp. HP-6]|uniref:DUF262 domain-containing protein n=1 Tax=unclassified Acidithiobacillus TaxID=2614800 RepID=UPI00187AEEF9|nr:MULTISPECIES: DUF262 domain-containing protein [unclassified Acidithiobacillus]MBE7564154.1 DUF262 domain-containing protein [Acidithiobacillus sp. HP-6]MBE7569074.1 DUF262 domain-containing protein [Acidithiobacillus sp. HP-2]